MSSRVGDAGSGLTAIAVDSVTGVVYAAAYLSDTVSVIRNRAVAATIGVGNGPEGVAVNPWTGTVYTANFGAGTVSVISR